MNVIHLYTTAGEAREIPSPITFERAKQLLGAQRVEIIRLNPVMRMMIRRGVSTDGRRNSVAEQVCRQFHLPRRIGGDVLVYRYTSLLMRSGVGLDGEEGKPSMPLWKRLFLLNYKKRLNK